MPYQTKGSQGTEYQLDIAKVIQWRIDRMIELEHQNHQRKPKDQDDPARRKLQAETELVELKVQMVKDSLVTVEDAQQAICEAVEALSDKTLTTIHTEALENAKGQ